MKADVRGVVFDVGYTLLDETRRWREWAEWLKVKPEALLDALRTAIADGMHHVEALKQLAPGFDIEMARIERERAGRKDEFLPQDLYRDVSPCIARLRAAGIKLGAAGNMSADVETFLRASGLGFAMIGSSGRWGVEKPDPSFFSRVAEAMALPAETLAYVGDRLDNDIQPAAKAGMAAVFLRRGPWAEIQGATGDAAAAYAVIDSLEELPGAIAGASDG